MSNLENLKKQAKQVLRWHRERHWPVAEQLRNTLPELADLNDRQVLDYPIKLADAQRFVALRAGYASWAELKSDQPGPEDTPQDADKPKLVSVQPHVFVRDIDAACAYYNEKLGFTTSFKYGEPPFFAQLERDELSLSLRAVDAYILDAKQLRNKEEELLAASFAVQSIKSLYEDYLAREATVFQALRTEPWGQKSFIVEDADGNLLLFGSD
ncbi:MAG: VOC family protein [Pseudomonadales bacterium]|nr:VOC family protein [Pseudomonadales bacterium]